MTMYTEDVNYRMRTVFAILALLSIGFAFALHGLLPAHPRVVTPVTLAFFGALLWLFDALLWKLPVIRLLNSGIPNLAGTWEGSVTRIVDGAERHIDAELVVRQTWSKLNLVLRTAEAMSRNKLVGLVLANPDAIIMTWIFQKDDRNAKHLTESGRGIIELTLHRTSRAQSLEGATMTGSFITTGCGEPMQVAFKKPGPFYWNPEPF